MKLSVEKTSTEDGTEAGNVGRLSSSKSNAPRLVLRVSAPTPDGFKCIARKGTQVRAAAVRSSCACDTLAVDQETGTRAM
eukprot:3938833-Rhodomonas_salina.1